LANAIAQRYEPWNDRPDAGALIENFTLTEIRKNSSLEIQTRFWRTHKGAEVDFVVVSGRDILPIEVKTGLTKPTIHRGLINFLESYQAPRGIVLGQSIWETRNHKTTRVQFLPWTIFFLGANRILGEILEEIKKEGRSKKHGE
jgi:hypothetical protein